jgi:LPXTG-motif cell wall-anchored protein
MKILSHHNSNRRFLTVGALVLASLSGSLGLGLQSAGAQSAGASTPTGVLSPYATLTNPNDNFYALTADPAGNLYTVDITSCEVIKINATTQASSVISTNTNWCSRALNMTYAVVAGTPTLIIADYGNGAIYTVPVTGGGVTQVGSETAPAGVAYDSSSDTLYIADWDTGEAPLWKITSFSTCTNANQCNATEISTSSSTGVSYAKGLLLQGSTLYSLSYGTSGLLASISTSGGAWTNSYDAVGSQSDAGNPAADPAGNIYYLDYSGNNVYELPAGGSTSTAMTISGGSLYAPPGGPVYSNGALYVVDYSQEGTFSIVKITLPAAVPTNVTATPGNGSATVSWTASPGATSYTVTSSPGGQTCTATAPSTSCVVSGLTNGTSYTFSVVATNSAGASGPSTASAPVTPAAPAVTVAAATLAKTGSPLGSTLLVGLCALSLGTMMILGRRRRHQVS